MSDRAPQTVARFALRSLWKRRTQFALALVTLVVSFWGCFQIVAVVSSLERQAKRDFQRVGMDIINVHPHLDPLKFFGHKLTVNDCEPLAALVSGVAAGANLDLGVVHAEMPAPSADPPAEESVGVIASTPQWNEALAMDFLWGRFFRGDESDVCVLDEWVFRRVYPGEDVAVERSDVRITLELSGKSVSLRVIGVVRDPFRLRRRLEDFDSTGAARSHVIRFMEYKNVYIPRVIVTTGEKIILAIVRVGEGRDPERDTELVRKYLEDKGSTAVAWSRRSWASDILSAVETVAAISNFLWIVILAVTAFMVVTVIFIIVRGRYREIAIRRVEGARKSQITAQLVLENLFLACLANAIAFPLCVYSSRRLNEDYLGNPVFLDPLDVLLISVAGAAVIALTTILPARRAAALDPVAVLRNDKR